MSEQTQTTAPAPGPQPPDPLPPWSAIADAGGIRAWVDAELRRRDLIDDRDPSRLSDKQKKQYKARRDEERRVRKQLKALAWAAYRRAHLVHLGLGVFYHDTADYDRFDVADPDARRADNDLPPLKDVQALAGALDLPIPRLRWLAYHRDVDTGTHYHRWTVPKRTGGERLISAPKPDLKRAQRWIAHHITEHLPVHGAAHGFLAGRSTVTNAAVHAGARVVVKLDLADFYPTVTLPRVKGVFRKAGYTEQVAVVLALLCTEAPREEMVLRGRKYHVATGPRSLPQGAPTSPSITNALSLRMDRRLAGLARKLGFRYTRYADDLTFSWHDGDPRADRDGRDPGDAPVGHLLRAVERVVVGEGFRVHAQKTRIMRAGRRQKVTGLVVNAPGGGGGSGAGGDGRDGNGGDGRGGNGAIPPARVPRAMVRKLRAAIHNRERGKPGGGETLEQLRGWAAYVYMTNPERGRQLLDRLAALGDDRSEP